MGSNLNDHVGKQIRTRRKELKLTLKQVSEVVGISGQALFKYETGETRIPASALWALSEALAVPTAYFFDGFLSPRALSGAAVMSSSPHP